MQAATIVLLFVAFVMLFFVYLILMGASDFHEKDCIGYSFNKLMAFLGDSDFPLIYLYVDVWSFAEFTSSNDCQRFLERIFGVACSRRLVRIQNYVCYQKNPILAIFYLCLVAAGFVIFVVFAFPYLPFHPDEPWGISSYHKINAFIVIGVCLIIFYLAMYTDPGIITEQNIEAEVKRFPYDMIIYCKKTCSTCHLLRPARSKHCSTCNVCVARFDHHCPWINNCVGANNVRHFLAFLLAHAFLCLYGGVLLGHILWAIVSAENLMNMYIRGDAGELVPVSYAVALRWLVHQHPPLVGLCFALVMISLVLAAFFGYHLSLVLFNTTTNETFKWQDLRRQIRFRQKLADKRRRGAEAAGVAEAEAEAEVEGGEEEESGDGEDKLRGVSRLEELVNAYHRGFSANLCEALFPHVFLAAAVRSPRPTPPPPAPATPPNPAASASSGKAGSGRGGGSKARRGKGRGAAEETEALLGRVERASRSLGPT